MAAVDAQFHWLSAKVPSDQFLLYAFDGVVDDVDAVVAGLLARAATCAELGIRVDAHRLWRYPRWIDADVRSAVSLHQLADATWAGCLGGVAALADAQLDSAVLPWRLHVFGPVADVPGSSGPAMVAVLQVAHAVADGTRASALAAWLFGRPGAPPAPPVPEPGRWLPRARAAARAHRQLVADTDAGVVPPPGPARALSVTNARPSGRRMVRTLVRNRGLLPGPTVTVAVLAAVATALVEHLGIDAPDLGAEVPMAKSGTPLAFNHFRNVGVGLYPEAAWEVRCDAIVGDLAARRRRAGHPASRADDLAFAKVPAPLLRWGISKFDPDLRSPTVGGNTVVSSVYRGAADLRFGGLPVLFTAGYPALSPMMGLVHGVHGIGDVVAVSVHAAESAVGDIDAYVAVLGEALDCRR